MAVAKKNLLLSRRFWLLVALLLLLFVWIGLRIQDRRSREKQVVIPTTVSKTSSSSAPTASSPDKATNATGGSTPASTKPVDNKPSPSGNQTTLKAPSGQFVSNHRPSLSGKSAPSKEQSVCNTTPGATCTIQFTKDGFTKSLEAKTADSNGVAIWDWDVNEAGFTTGSWQIKATATLNSQTLSSQDSLALEVQP